MPRKFSLEDFDEPSRATLKAAQDMAEARNHSHVDICHFLLAWLDRGRNHLQEKLADAEVDVPELRRRLESLLKGASRKAADQVFVGRPLLDALQRVALRHVVADSPIPMSDVLVELLRSDAKPGAALCAAGVTRELVERVSTDSSSFAERLTPDGRACLRRATEMAFERRHAAVTPAHILAAMLTSNTQIPPDEILDPVEAHLAMLPTEGSQTPPALDDDCLAALEFASGDEVGPAELVTAIRVSGFELLTH